MRHRVDNDKFYETFIIVFESSTVATSTGTLKCPECVLGSATPHGNQPGRKECGLLSTLLEKRVKTATLEALSTSKQLPGLRNASFGQRCTESDSFVLNPVLSYLNVSCCLYCIMRKEDPHYACHVNVERYSTVLYHMTACLRA